MRVVAEQLPHHVCVAPLCSLCVSLARLLSAHERPGVGETGIQIYNVAHKLRYMRQKSIWCFTTTSAVLCNVHLNLLVDFQACAVQLQVPLRSVFVALQVSAHMSTIHRRTTQNPITYIHTRGRKTSRHTNTQQRTESRLHAKTLEILSRELRMVANSIINFFLPL